MTVQLIPDAVLALLLVALAFAATGCALALLARSFGGRRRRQGAGPPACDPAFPEAERMGAWTPAEWWPSFERELHAYTSAGWQSAREAERSESG